MAKKVYHIPLQKALQFIKANKTEINRLTTDTRYLEYAKQLGKCYYYLQIEEFIKFFKIDKDLTHSLKTMEYFNSAKFFEEISALINISQFDLEKTKTNTKDFFYGLFYIFNKTDNQLFELFIHKIFLHHHTAFNSSSNINIDYKDMSHTIAKSKNLTLKESFGEDEKDSFFKILLDDKVTIDEKGKLIKTLRKKAYKNLFYYLIDLEDKVSLDREEAYNRVQDLKDM